MITCFKQAIAGGSIDPAVATMQTDCDIDELQSTVISAPANGHVCIPVQQFHPDILYTITATGQTETQIGSVQLEVVVASPTSPKLEME